MKSKKSLKLHHNSWYGKFIRPSPLYPLPCTEFDSLLYVVTRTHENQHKPQTAENRNYLNHIETSPFRPVHSGQEKSNSVKLN